MRMVKLTAAMRARTAHIYFYFFAALIASKSYSGGSMISPTTTIGGYRTLKSI
jgi:hypothetical protein